MKGYWFILGTDITDEEAGRSIWFVSDGELIFPQPNLLLPVLTDSAGLHGEVPENHGEGADHAAF